tara:strand:- start:1790 stop:1903 length:114 start_codon:yes stop_codon:yes gene_type:complete
MERSYLKDSIKGIIQEVLSATLKDEKLFMKKNILLMK